MSNLRFAVDTGGTFTDLVIENEAGELSLYKAPTTPRDPIEGVLNVLQLAADDLGINSRTLLGRGDLFIHATTRAINAILTGSTARTAFLTTKGHPDILLFREGGRTDLFNWTRPYPAPYIPRALTFQVPERIGAQGEIVVPLDEAAVVELCGTLRDKQVEAVAVCLLWSIVNSSHEARVGELLAEHLPGIPVTLSHHLNPSIREYRRASSAAIDASLKPVMSKYLASLDAQLREAGFKGRVLVVTSTGGVLDAAYVAKAPIHSLGSGPAMAPVAGRAYAALDAGAQTAIIADTGGTSYDVSLVRRGHIPRTRETWLGQPYHGHLTGFPSIDVKSIGAGGGSIAWVDDGGLLHVGPQSAGAEPGPVCYGRGGHHATVTDAALTLSYIDPEYFLGGAMRLDATAARNAVSTQIGAPLRLSAEAAAEAIMQLATEHMARATEEITVNQGIDPRNAVLVCGGGAAGLNAVAIARRLGCRLLLIPNTAAALSAAGALMSELSAEYEATLLSKSTSFNFSGVNALLDGLKVRCDTFIAGPGAGSSTQHVEFSVEARYPNQNWELPVPLRVQRFDTLDHVEQLRQDFHIHHKEVFGIADLESEIEVVSFRARVSCRLHEEGVRALRNNARERELAPSRKVYFASTGWIDARVLTQERITAGEPIAGPAIIESPVTSVVIDPGCTVERRNSGTLVVLPWGKSRASDAHALAKFEVGAQ
jgi:N-methylhydantoinase A